jgi:hypothetical protein
MAEFLPGAPGETGPGTCARHSLSPRAVNPRFHAKRVTPSHIASGFAPGGDAILC